MDLNVDLCGDMNILIMTCSYNLDDYERLKSLFCLDFAKIRTRFKKRYREKPQDRIETLY